MKTYPSLFLTRQSFAQGDIIFDIGDKRDHAYLIEHGCVVLSADPDNKYFDDLTIGTGELFGENALIESGLRDARAVAKEETVVYVISPETLKDRMADMDPLVTLLMSLLVGKYRENRLEAVGVKTESSHNEAIIAEFSQQSEKVLEELQAEQELRRAIENREFKPYLQPIVEFGTGRIVGFETLSRWHHPEHGIIFPNDFIPIAERTNVVQLIDLAMLEAACELIPQMRTILRKAADDIFISVNLSGANFNDDSVIERVKSVIEQVPFNPAQIKLEITESALVDDSYHAAIILKELKELGVTIDLDDFGTGYSSLGYLHKFQIDGLKIDRSFVVEMHNSEKSIDIIKAVVGLAQTFSLSIIAEGIEAPKEIAMLKLLGCSYGQGYFFGRPSPVENTFDLLRDNGGYLPQDIMDEAGFNYPEFKD